MKIAAQLIDKAKSLSVKICAAESCTGGMLMAELTAIAGASQVIDRGFVTYSNEAKMDMLGVNSQTLHDFGAVSIQTADEMARGALSHSLANIAVSITGIAGPGGSEHKPEGLVCFGLAMRDLSQVNEIHSNTYQVEFSALGRQQVRQNARDYALKLMLECLQDK